jgi:hypothetical protein
MRLIRGEVTDALGIESEVIDFGSANIISGGNATGKTSWVDIIEKGYNNTDRRDRFVRTGAEKAFIKLKSQDEETGEIVDLLRVVGEDNKTLDLKVTRDGVPVRAPQTYIDETFGVTKERKDLFAFNPVDFMLKNGKEQAKTLLSMIPYRVTQQNLFDWFGKIIPVNLNSHGILVLKEAYKYWYDARHEANGVVKSTKAKVEAMKSQLPDNYKVEEWENTDTISLSDKIRDGEQVNNYRIQAQGIIDGIEVAKKAVNDKYDLQIKEKQEYKEFRTKKAHEEIEDLKQSIKDDIVDLQCKIKDHKDEIEKLKQLIRDEESAIKDIENKIQLRQNDLDNFDNSILTTKTQSLENELNTTIEHINENRNKELETVEERFKKAETYLVENTEVEIEPLENNYKEAVRMIGFIEMAHNLQKLEKQLENETEVAEKYDQFVKFCENKPQELLKNMDLPVEGISIYYNVEDEKDSNNGSALFDGQTLKNYNTAMQIRKCVSIAMAYAKDTKFKFIQVDRLESLDTDSKREFYRQIRANPNYQFIVTVVTNGKRCIDIIDVNYMSGEQFEKWLETVK